MSKSKFCGLFPLMELIAVFALGLISPAKAPAQSKGDREDGIGDRVRKLAEIYGQKTEAEVKNALADARKRGAKDPAAAVTRLRKVVINLENDQDLTDSVRARLLRQVKTQLAFWKDKSEAQIKDEAARNDQKSRKKYYQNNSDTNRRKRYEDLRDEIKDRKRFLEEGKRLRKEREARWLHVMRDIDRSAMPPLGEIEFPKDWHKRVAKRKILQLTKKEASLLRTLNSVISVNFKNEKFEDVIQYLMDKTGQPILLDKEALKEKEVEYETPITLRANKMSVRTLLRKLLNDLGLTYVIKDETIQVTTLEKARKMMVVRSYYVGDLIGIPNPQLGPIFNQLQAAQNVKMLIDMVKRSIEPTSWAEGEGDGQGTVTFDWSSMSLVVKQTSEIHYRMKASFAR